RLGVVEETVRYAQRFGADAWSHKVGLRGVIDRRRSTRAERGHRVVRPVRRPHMARRPDGEHPRRVARRRDAAVLRLALRAPPTVPGRGYYDNARVDGALRGLRQ